MTLKDKLKQAEIQPGYEYHESVEDALGQLPRRPMKRPAPRTAKLAGTIAAVLLILAIPMCIPGAR
ncbi:hypothetical protein LJC33_08950, partial [Eubacteriales bacterium OttesenSCG-928-N13]|nr:hypothetical protein [Eubacteriales bacterium OttesenSCG-928-N13]